MKKNRKWIIVILTLIIIIPLIASYIAYQIDTKVPETDKSMKQILEENKEDLDIETNTSNITHAEDIYKMIHEMANTLIVAEDGLVYGEISINDQSINRAMKIIKDTAEIYEDEKLVFMNILQDWKEGDFSNGVQAHNYAWNRLNGTIGRAKDLREKYK